MDTLDLDTSLVALYTNIDDLYKAHFPEGKPRAGHKPVMSDSEILTLGLCLQWLKWPERRMFRYVNDHWRGYFPGILSRSEFNRRFNALGIRLAYLVPLIKQEVSGYTPSFEILDCVPVPLMKRCRGEKAKLFSPEIANIGIGGSDRDWYYGVKLGLLVTPEGTITAFIMAPAKTSDRWPAEYMLCYRNNPGGKPAEVGDLPPSHGKKRVGPGGTIWPKCGIGTWNPRLYLTDRGFTGVWWEEHWEKEYNAHVLTPESYGDERELRSMHSSSRQVIEDVNGHLSHDLGLNRIGARSDKGLLSRIVAKLLAFNIGTILNRLFGRNTFAISTLLSL
jgi:hypothetical protein